MAIAALEHHKPSHLAASGWTVYTPPCLIRASTNNRYTSLSLPSRTQSICLFARANQYGGNTLPALCIRSLHDFIITVFCLHVCIRLQIINCHLVELTLSQLKAHRQHRDMHADRARTYQRASHWAQLHH